jgi:hypothetical protein
MRRRPHSPPCYCALLLRLAIAPCYCALLLHLSSQKHGAHSRRNAVAMVATVSHLRQHLPLSSSVAAFERLHCAQQYSRGSAVQGGKYNYFTSSGALQQERMHPYVSRRQRMPTTFLARCGQQQRMYRAASPTAPSQRPGEIRPVNMRNSATSHIVLHAHALHCISCAFIAFLPWL